MTVIDRARSVIALAVEEFGSSLAILTSFQREGVVIIDLVMAVAPHIPVMTIDTGRLPAATLDMIAAVESRYGIFGGTHCSGFDGSGSDGGLLWAGSFL